MHKPPTIGDWYAAYADEVYTFLAYFYTRTDVDDLVQETFTRALHGLRGYDGLASPKTWLMRIARNVAIDHFRRKKVTAGSEDLLAEVAANTKDPADTVAEQDAIEQMLSYLASIKPAYRQVVVLRSILDYSIRDTAQILGWSQTRVGVTHHRAMKVLKTYVEHEERRDDVATGSNEYNC